MTHRKWEPGTLYAKAMRDITNEHNATVDAWQAAEAEAERLGRANSDLCDQIAAIRVPFTDAQIERMAQAYFNDMHEVSKWEYADRALYRKAIRAALAAGGLEPCPVPDDAPYSVESHWQSIQPGLDADIDPLVDAYLRGYMEITGERETAIAYSRTGLAYVRDAVLAERSPIWTDDQIEVLAEVLHEAEPYMPPATYRERNEAMARAVLQHLAPYLRDPVEWELDVTEKQIRHWWHENVSGSVDVWPGEARALTEFFRSRIKPVYECAECAKWEKDCRALSAASRSIDARISALEGES